jgi:hypothetical protein
VAGGTALVTGAGALAGSAVSESLTSSDQTEVKKIESD